MSRIVNPRPRVFGATEVKDTFADKLERVAKYVPSEILATFLFLNSIAATESDNSRRLMWYGVAFLICLTCTPLYFYMIKKAGDSVLNQQVVSSIAFLLWSYSLGAGLFKEANLYYPIPAAFGIAVFSLISAFRVPKG